MIRIIGWQSNLLPFVPSTYRNYSLNLANIRKLFRAMSRIKYHYAKNQYGVIIDIADVAKEDRESQHFFCIGCGAEMIPKLGEVKARHFAHKVESPKCNLETYLHKLTKLCLKNKFDSSKTFEIAYWQEVKCSDNASCPFYREDECKEKKLKIFNLREYYDTCQEEERAGSFIADLKISSSYKSGVPPVTIEVFVSHKCTLPKKESGLKIIEVRIKDESDIKELISGPITEDEECRYSFEPRDPKCRFYGFNKVSKLSEPLDVRSIPRFYLFQSGSAFVSNMDEMRSCRECSKKDNPKAILELNIDTPYLYKPSPYEIGYVAAMNLGYEVKTCQLCKFRKNGYDSFYSTSANFCCLYKKYGTPQNPKSSDAMTCQYYRINNDLLAEIKQEMEQITVSVANK